MLITVLISVVLAAYKWLVCRLLVDSAERLRAQLASGADSFTARNNSQVYYARSLAIAYIEVRAKLYLMYNIYICILCAFPPPSPHTHTRYTCNLFMSWCLLQVFIPNIAYLQILHANFIT